MAVLALDDDVRHELHLNGYRALALALLAAPSRGVERKVRRREAHLLRGLLVCEESAYLVERFHVRHGVRTRGFA